MSQNMQNPGGQAGALRDLLSGGRSPHSHIASDSNAQTLDDIACMRVSAAFSLGREARND
jgi:hypothetical protein